MIHPNQESSTSYLTPPPPRVDTPARFGRPPRARGRLAALSAQTALSGVAVSARVQKAQAKRNVVTRAGRYDDELLETAVRNTTEALLDVSGFFFFFNSFLFLSSRSSLSPFLERSRDCLPI